MSQDIDSLIRRLRKVIDDSGLSYAELEKKTGVSKSALQRYANGSTKKIPIDVIQSIASAVNVPAVWIMGWTDDEDDIFTYSNIIPLPKTKRIPLLGNVSCGEPVYADEEHELFIESGAITDADFCLKASGDSMIGANIFDGDIVFVRRQDSVNNEDIAVVLIGDETTLKRVHYDSESKELALFAENPAYKTMRFRGAELEQVRILGKAIAFQRYL